MITARTSQTDKIDLMQTLSSFLSKACKFGLEERLVSMNQLSLARTAKGIKHLTLALILLSPLVVVNLSYAAGRVFYDGFEDGTTNKWLPFDLRPKCPVVTASVDGVLGPYAGTRMARCNAASGMTYETLHLLTTYNDELFLRVRFRRDQDMNAAQKTIRFYQQGPYHDMFEICGHPQNANNNAGNPNDNPNDYFPTYWGEAPGDNTNLPNSWHKIEYYIRQSTGTFKVWHDGILIRNDSGYDYVGVKWTHFYLASNGDATDGNEHTYYDEFEVFSDLGTGASGQMSDATISSGSGSQTVPNPPQNAQVTPTQ
jgi:hypothetical protein